MVYIKDPDAVLDWYFDWAAQTNETGDDDWLASGETITSADVTVSPTSLVIDSSTLVNGDTSVQAWLSGGTDGLSYTVTCHVVTSAGREDDRSITIRVQER